MIPIYCFTRLVGVSASNPLSPTSPRPFSTGLLNPCSGFDPSRSFPMSGMESLMRIALYMNEFPFPPFIRARVQLLHGQFGLAINRTLAPCSPMYCHPARRVPFCLIDVTAGLTCPDFGRCRSRISLSSMQKCGTGNQCRPLHSAISVLMVEIERQLSSICHV